MTLSKQQWVWLVLGSAGGLLLLWGLLFLGTPPLDIPKLGENTAANSYSDVNYQIRDMQGMPIYRVLAAQLDQFAHSRQIQLEQPQVEWLQRGYENSRAHAHHGIVKDQQLTLFGDTSVLIDPPGQSPILIQSKNLTLDSRSQQLHTEQTVLISERHALLRGTGLDYQIDENRIHLLSDVRTQRLQTPLHKPSHSLLSKLAASAFSSAHAEEPHTLDVIADHAEWDIEKKVYIYRGNVRATRDSLVLSADQISAFSDNDQVSRLLAEGQAVWTQKLDSGESMVANADRIYYEWAKRKVVLQGNVQLRSGDIEFEGEDVTWLLDEGRIATPKPAAGEKSQSIKFRLKTQ